MKKKHENLNDDEALELAKSLNEVDIDSLRGIQHHTQKNKCHRNILDIDSSIIDKTNSFGFHRHLAKNINLLVPWEPFLNCGDAILISSNPGRFYTEIQHEIFYWKAIQ